jgi:hypothetical protein
MASGAAAAAEGGAAAFAGIAAQEAMLAFAPDFRRLILAFHVIGSKDVATTYAGSNTPARGEPALRSHTG